MTEYIVLKEAGEETWRVFSRSDAQTAKAAVRKVVNDDPGRYVAIPARSFRPLDVDVETKRSIKIGGGGEVRVSDEASSEPSEPVLA